MYLKETVILIAFILILVIFFTRPVILLGKMLVRSVFFTFIIFLLNFITTSFNFSIGLNPVTSLVCGMFGVYGVVINYIGAILF